MASINRPVVVRVVVVRGGSVGGVEIDFEFAFGPEHNFVDRIVALEVVDLCVAALAAGEIEFGLAPHPCARPSRQDFCPISSDCSKIDHAHFFQAALDHAGARGAASATFSRCRRSTDFFCRAHKILHQEWLGDEILDAFHQAAAGALRYRLRLAMKRKGMWRVASRPRSFSKSWRPSRPGML